MSLTVGRDVDHAVGPDATWILVAAGLGLLLLRPAYAPGPEGPWLLTLVYLAIGTGSAFVVSGGGGPEAPARSSPSGALPVAAALVVGVGAFLLAASVIGPVIHLRSSAATLALTAGASLSEEALFRGVLYGRLARFGPLVAVAVSAVAFALVHIPAYPAPAVWVDLAAGGVFGWQRWVTGTWLTPAATHLAANLLAVTA